MQLNGGAKSSCSEPQAIPLGPSPSTPFDDYRETERQEVLTRPDPLELWIILDEAVIRRAMGPPDLMGRQLAHLCKASLMPNVTLQVMPLGAGAHPGMAGSFMMMSFPEPADPDVVYVNYSTGSLFLEKPEEVARSALIFNHLCAAALSISQSREMVSHVQQELA